MRVHERPFGRQGRRAASASGRNGWARDASSKAPARSAQPAAVSNWRRPTPSSAVTFGQPLAKRQSIQWRLVDTYVALEAATLLVHRAAARIDRGEDDRNDAYLVKLFCTEMAWQAADMCLQVHGGIGLTTDLPVERLWRDQRSHMITEGTPEIMRMALARHVLNTFGQ